MMGYAKGENNNGKLIGYGVEAFCEKDGCDRVIDRGIDYCCGGIEGCQNAGMEYEPYCGGFFCSSHLFFIPSLGRFDSGMMVCTECLVRAICPKCKGEGQIDDELCDSCDSYGVVTKTYVHGKGVVPV